MCFTSCDSHFDVVLESICRIPVLFAEGCSWQRVLNLLICKDPLYRSHPQYQVLPYPNSPTSFFALFLWLIMWLLHIYCISLLNDIFFIIMDLDLVSEASCCVVYAWNFEVHGKFCTDDMAFASTLIFCHQGLMQKNN